MNEIVLEALDGTNPIGFLAALGVLEAMTDRRGGEAPRLQWRNEGTWRPVLHCDTEDVLDELDADRLTWRNEPVLDLAYEKSNGKQVRDLKPPPGQFRSFLLGLNRGRDTSRRSLAYAAAFATDIATDNSGNTKPTALHFTAGQQLFLEMVRELVKEVTREDLEEALFGPWRYDRKLPSLRWDATVNRDYALRADNPSKDKKTVVPGANWLAFRGLSLLTAVPVGTKIKTTCCRGRWMTGQFTWPLWSAAIAASTARSLLRSPSLEDRAAEQRAALGISIIFRSDIRREGQGYGGFGPAVVV